MKRNLSIIIFQNRKQIRVEIPMPDITKEESELPRVKEFFEYPADGIFNPANNETGYIRIMETVTHHT